MLQTHTTGITYGKSYSCKTKEILSNLQIFSTLLSYTWVTAIARVKFSNFLTHLITLILVSLLARVRNRLVRKAYELST